MIPPPAHHHDQYSPFPPPPAGSNNDQAHPPHLISFFPTSSELAPSSTCSSISYHPSQALLSYDHDRQLQVISTSNDHHHYPSDGSCTIGPCVMPEVIGVKNSSNKAMQFTSGSVKWVPSKMRFMKKMMSSAGSHQQLTAAEGNSSSSSSSTLFNGGARVCSDCNTTKTPLWRSGPQGPKSLCNACGIRQRKARKAMAAAAAGGEAAASVHKKVQKEKGSSAADMSARYATIPFKKRCKLSSTTTTKAQKNISISLDHHQMGSTPLHPQDEKEAAILLMALSCGLIYG